MKDFDDNSLSELTIDNLYQLLGTAWLAQLRPHRGDAHYLGSSSEMGKLEFDSIAEALQHDLSSPYSSGPVAHVASTIRRHASWAMPEYIVAELAQRAGFVDARQNDRTMRPPQSCLATPWPTD